MLCQGEHLGHCSPSGGPCTTLECGYAVTHLDLSFQSGYLRVPLSLCKIHCGALRTVDQESWAQRGLPFPVKFFPWSTAPTSFPLWVHHGLVHLWNSLPVLIQQSSNFVNCRVLSRIYFSACHTSLNKALKLFFSSSLWNFSCPI